MHHNIAEFPSSMIQTHDGLCIAQSHFQLGIIILAGGCCWIQQCHRRASSTGIIILIEKIVQFQRFPHDRCGRGRTLQKASVNKERGRFLGDFNDNHKTTTLKGATTTVIDSQVHIPILSETVQVVIHLFSILLGFRQTEECIVVVAIINGVLHHGSRSSLSFETIHSLELWELLEHGSLLFGKFFFWIKPQSQYLLL
jgi:hypothetical protein